jgi:hypothetical protein
MKFGKYYNNIIKNINNKKNNIIFYNYKYIKNNIKTINKLKELELNKLYIHLDLEDTNINECPICLESLTSNNSIKLSCCNQYFHPLCIINSMEKKINCPLCRFDLSIFFTNFVNMNINIYIIKLIANIKLFIIDINEYYKKLLNKKKMV